MNTIRVATYNIHKCVGLDQRFSPERIAEVLGEIDADVVALQEVVCHSNLHRRHNQAEFLASELGMEFCFGENRKHNGADYGNVILSRRGIERFQNFDITIHRREPRGCLWAEIPITGSQSVHFVNLHLGTSYFERRKQVHKLLAAHVLDLPHLSGRRIIAGDFNEWTSGLTTKLFRSRFRSIDPRLHRGAGPTFPSILPILNLDHVYFDDAFRLKKAELHRTRKSRVASDHLPIVAEFEI